MQERPGQIGDYWLTQRPGSRQWCRTWYDPATRQTRRASLGTADFQEGKLRLWEWYAKHGKADRQAPQDVPLDLVLVRYYEQHAQSQASAETARIALGYWSEHFGAATVAEVTPGEQRRFVDWLRGKGLADGYVKRILGVGKSALNRAYREGEISSVPFVVLVPDGQPRDRVLTPAESAALWAAATLPHERMFLALAYGTLARPEAILALHKAFVDFDRGLLVQNPPGRRQTRKYRPIVPVAGFLRPMLAAAPDGPLVAWKGQPIKSIKTAWRRMRAQAGLEDAVVPKTVRHTMATELRAAGVPEAEIQGFLGHKAFSGKTGVYAHYRPDYLSQALPVIDGYMARLRVSCV